MSNFIKLSDFFYIDESDVGSLVNIRTPGYNLSRTNYNTFSTTKVLTLRNCLIVSVEYNEKTKIRPESVKLLNMLGKTIILSMKNINTIEIENIN